MGPSVQSTLRHAVKGPFGDAKRHLYRDILERVLAELAPPPKERGTLVLIVARKGGSRRETPESVRLSVHDGLPADLWRKNAPERLDQQLAVMRVDIATLIANGQPLTLFGDQLFLDLDLSSANLPAGSRLRVGEALLAVTPEPHNGCIKFRQRFGGDALRMTLDERFRHDHLRGIYLQVLEDGEVATGDSVEVVSRPENAG
jgi:hypothetical protein